MRNRIFAILFLFGIGILLPGCDGDANQKNPDTVGPATASPVDPATKPGTDRPTSASMSVSVYIVFGNPPSRDSIRVDKGSEKKGDKKDGKKGKGTHEQGTVSSPRSNMPDPRLPRWKFIPRGRALIDSTGQGESCGGKRICEYSAIRIPNATLVTFTINEDNPDVLLMSFSLSRLRQNQQEQAVFFSDPNTDYMFQNAFNLCNLFSCTLLPEGSKISPNSASRLTLGADGDTITDAITFDHE